ncbi:VWA domain-containing protein [Kibdelosporangium aridum]|uniref:VWA domain-containing protein n=2 Tax=Kibdelosporangium aridum TaxID=2030 RepID=A0A428ZJ42_KIBAR|nr:VWA domain-containing protein [Kibdelosporangium aridum]
MVLALVSGAVMGVIVLVSVLILVPATDRPANCVRLVTSSSTEKGDLIKELADRYNAAGRTFGGRCARIESFKKTSGATMDLLAAGKWTDTEEGQPEPQVWMPSSALWLGLLEQRGKSGLIGAGQGTSLTVSPMVIAMPNVMAEALGWPHKDIGWSDLNLNSRGGWAATGRQNERWGRFTLGKDNPLRSTSGLAATIATYHAATKGNYNNIDTADAVAFVRGVEASVAYYSDDSVPFLKTLYDEDQKTDTPYISAMVMQEQMAYLYNNGAPTGDPKQLVSPVKLNRPLVSIQPKEGTLIMDHPFYTLASAAADQKDAARDFYEFMLEKPQQDRFQELGFRDRSGTASDKVLAGANAKNGGVPNRIEVPSTADLDRMLKAWEYTQRRGRILLVLDTSGSMSSPFDKNRKDPPFSTKRMDLLKPAVQKQLNLLHDDDEVGLWTFATSSSIEQVPIGKAKDVRGRISSIVDGLKPDQDTALYKTVFDASKKMQAEFDQDRINAIVLLSDGVDTEGGVTKEELLNQIDASRLDNTVRIFTIAYSPDADKGVLTEIADKSKARTYDAGNPVNVDRMFVYAFSNF